MYELQEHLEFSYRLGDIVLRLDPVLRGVQPSAAAVADSAGTLARVMAGASAGAEDDDDDEVGWLLRTSTRPMMTRQPSPARLYGKVSLWVSAWAH